MDLVQKWIAHGVGDRVAEPMPGVGHVGGLSVWTRLALGREAHTDPQRIQADQHSGYASEVAIRYRSTVDAFVVTIQGRMTG